MQYCFSSAISSLAPGPPPLEFPPPAEPGLRFAPGEIGCGPGAASRCAVCDADPAISTTDNSQMAPTGRILFSIDCLRCCGRTRQVLDQRDRAGLRLGWMR